MEIFTEENTFYYGFTKNKNPENLGILIHFQHDFKDYDTAYVG